MTAPAAASVAELVCRARDPHASIRQQHAAFNVLVERFEEMAFTTALRASEDLESARDACQDAFLAAWRLLPQLREPAAFGGWLKRLIRTQCSRARRRRSVPTEVGEAVPDPAGAAGEACDPAERACWDDALRRIRNTVAGLPERERQAVLLFYFLGEPLRVVARALGVSEGTAGKCVFAARLRLRRCLPRAIAEAFLAVAPAPAFTRRVSEGVFDEFVGEYRFAERPQHPVFLRREGDVIAGYAGGQRNVLASHELDTLVSTEFDGEGRFRRDRHGQISHFIYYEFGRRLGSAHKVGPPIGANGTRRPSDSSGAS